MKHLRGFSRDEEAISGAVTATLIIAMLTLTLTGIYTVVVPVWLETTENNHMHKVTNDFTSMKKNIEVQIEQGDKPLVMSSEITLRAEPTTNFFGIGGKVLSGTLTIDPYSERFNLTNAENTYETYGSSQGAIYFEPKNQQYAGGATLRYIYANGAVLRVQTKSGVVVTPPIFNLVDEAGNRTLYVSTIRLLGEPTAISGSKSVTVETKTLNALIADYEGGVWDSKVNVTLNGNSNMGYASVYKTFYEERLDVLGFQAGKDYQSTLSGDNFSVTIKNVTKVKLYTGTIEVKLN